MKQPNRTEITESIYSKLSLGCLLLGFVALIQLFLNWTPEHWVESISIIRSLVGIAASILFITLSFTLLKQSKPPISHTGSSDFSAAMFKRAIVTSWGVSLMVFSLLHITNIILFSNTISANIYFETLMSTALLTLSFCYYFLNSGVDNMESEG